MQSVHNQVWNQYLSMVKTEKIQVRQPEVLPERSRAGRISDAPASKPLLPTKGKYIDIVI